MQRQIEEGVVSPHLAVVKATLLSILPLFIPPRYHNEIALDLARRLTEVATCISKLIEQGETSSIGRRCIGTGRVSLVTLII